MVGRIYLTGGTGFVGAALTRQLLRCGNQVGLLVRKGGRAWPIKDEQLLTILEGDLFDIDSVKRSLDQFRPDLLLHLGWTGITSKDRDSKIQIENHFATLRLVQAGIEIGIKAFVGVGSQAEYGPKQGLIAESDTCNPTSLYGASKLASCTIAKQMCRNADVRFVWLRLFSCYGPGDTSTFLIPTLIETLLRRECPSLTSGNQVWDYLYVDDAAHAIKHVATTPTASGIYNLASGSRVTIREVAEQVRDLIDKDLRLGFGELENSRASSSYLQADISRLLDTGWKPSCSLQDGLLRTLNWHKKKNSP